ncbi:MAG TPA: DUF4359 domain-containing protein [Chryseosolibacter sp.]
MKISLIIVVILLGAALLTNPSKSDHTQAVKDMIAEKLNNAMVDGISTSKNTWEAAGSVIGMSLGMGFVNTFLENMVFRKNYLLFSLTEIRFQGKSRTIGVGAFGNVWILDDAKDRFNQGHFFNEPE